MLKVDFALSLFNGNYNCSQAVFASFADESCISKEFALRISCGFGAGMASQQLSCGTFTGAMMVIGLKYGNYQSDDTTSKEKTYKIIHKFKEEFLIRHSSLECRKLVGCDFNTEEGKKYFRENNIQQDVCSKCIKDAIEILEDILKAN